MSYSSGTKYVHGNHALANGLSFAAPDPSLGDASLSIAVLSPAHSATYQCKVKKSPGVDMWKVSLVVMGKIGYWVALLGLTHITWLHNPSALNTSTVLSEKDILVYLLLTFWDAYSACHMPVCVTLCMCHRANFKLPAVRNTVIP